LPANFFHFAISISQGNLFLPCLLKPIWTNNIMQQKPSLTLSARTFLGNLWQLIRPYWFSEERWIARGLLAALVALNLGIVYVMVLINQWNQLFYNALQEKDYAAFSQQLIRFSILAAIYIAMAVYQLYFNQMLQIRWRRWLTEVYLNDWLSDRVYYRLELKDYGTDNPDQRISQDLQIFAGSSLSLALGLLSSVVTLISFVSILWMLSGTLTVAVAGTDISVPGYMVWVALVYAAAGTYLTRYIGKPLIGLLALEMGHIRIPHDPAVDPFPGNCPFHGDCFEGLANGPAIQARFGSRGESIHDAINDVVVEQAHQKRGRLQRKQSAEPVDFAHGVVHDLDPLLGEPQERPSAHTVKPVGVEADGRLRHELLDEQEEADRREQQDLQRFGDVVSRVRMVVHGIRQHPVEIRRVAADEDAEEGGDRHCGVHVPRRFLGKLAHDARHLPELALLHIGPLPWQAATHRHPHRLHLRSLRIYQKKAVTLPARDDSGERHEAPL